MGRRRVVDPHDHERVKERVADEGQQDDQAPVAGPERDAERARRPRHRQEHGGGDRAAERGEGERREERLRGLDRRVAAAPDQDDEEENRDDARVGRASSGGGSGRDAQRFFMSSGKLEEKECDFTTF